MPTYTWYQQLIKPSWAPPAYLFGPVWSVLYIIIAISFSKVFILVWQKQAPLIVALPFVLNLIFNALFTPIQFGLKSNWLAALDIGLVFITLVWAMIAIFPYARWVSVAQIPYLLWVTFATVLQLSITFLNR
ncbi:MAG: TspO/MBR family protein [Candidatus Falkowbacteria bacterium]